MENVRRLWASVVIQAYDDLESEPYGEYWWLQAAAFFVSAGEWAESRRAICQYLDIDPARLREPAMRIINARRAQEGLPPLDLDPPKPKPAPVVMPKIIALPAPEPPRRAKQKTWRERYEFNPFLPLPSETRATGTGD